MLERNGITFADYTTLHLGGTPIAELVPESDEDLANLEYRLNALGGSPLWLGRGSNVLASDGQIPVVIVRLPEDSQPVIIGTSEDEVLVQANAGMPLPRLLRFCIKHGLSGLEGLAGIPGSVGGAIAMNAGSFGYETGACLKKIGIWVNGQRKTFSREEITTKYRGIAVPGFNDVPLILDAIFALTRRAKSVIFTSINHHFFQKKSRQPIDSWSAGCAFKNPPDNDSAGYLLEQAGFRGKKYGGMAFSEKHANFLINEGSGSASAALDFLAQAADEVYKKFKVKLEPEVRIIQ